MTDHRPPPPGPEECLTRSRASRYKGGTLIAEDVHGLGAHQRRLADPDGYRPRACPRCGGRVLHVHDYPCRKPRGEPGLPTEVRIVRHVCAGPKCAAIWRTLPAFLARHLWRAWPTVERTVRARSPPPSSPPIPRKTARRWSERLASSARQLVVLLATSGGVLLEEIAKRTGHESTRLTLVHVHAEVSVTPPERQLAELAAIVHRLERGIRLM